MEAKDKKKYGYFNDYSGATHKVEILDETISGKYVVRMLNFTGEIWMVDKDKIMGIKEV